MISNLRPYERQLERSFADNLDRELQVTRAELNANIDDVVVAYRDQFRQADEVASQSVVERIHHLTAKVARLEKILQQMARNDLLRATASLVAAQARVDQLVDCIMSLERTQTTSFKPLDTT